MKYYVKMRSNPLVHVLYKEPCRFVVRFFKLVGNMGRDFKNEPTFPESIARTLAEND